MTKTIEALRAEVAGLYARRINYELTDEEARDYQEKDLLLSGLLRATRGEA